MHFSAWQTLYSSRRSDSEGRVTALVKAKFHYASWFGAGSEPASVIEFGFNYTKSLAPSSVLVRSANYLYTMQ